MKNPTKLVTLLAAASLVLLGACAPSPPEGLITHSIQTRQLDDGIVVEITPMTAKAIAAEAQ